MKQIVILLLFVLLACPVVFAQNVIKRPAKTVVSNPKQRPKHKNKKTEELSPANADIKKRNIPIIQSGNEVMKDPDEYYSQPVDNGRVVREQIQINRSGQSSDDNVFVAVEQQAGFPGGQAELMNFLAMNVRYPEAAQQNNVQGRVIVKFIVERDGSISNAQIVRGVDPDLDREALRVVKIMPRWEPGKNNGVVVRSWYTMPVTFRLAQ